METAELLASSGIRPIGQLGLVAGRDMPRALEACRTARAWVIGIDVFEPVAAGIRPIDALMADFSTLETLPPDERSVRSIAEAKSFMAAIGDADRYLFDLTID